MTPANVDQSISSLAVWIYLQLTLTGCSDYPRIFFRGNGKILVNVD